METKRWNLTNNQLIMEQSIKEAATLLKNGSIVGFPTETVYGLGADATNEKAVAAIFEAKGRPQDNPLIAHVATKDQLLQLVQSLPPFAEKLIDKFSPGPITYVLRSNGTCAENVTAGLPTIAVRIPAHPIAQKLLKLCNLPIAAPSANTSGKPSPTSAAHVWNDLAGKIAGILDGGKTGVGMESTVVDCTQETPIILRPGGITIEQMEQVVGMVQVDPGLVSEQDQPISPGMKYRHYSPDIPLWLIDGNAAYMQQIIDQEHAEGHRIGVLASTTTANKLTADHIKPLGNSLAEVATHLYDGLRTFKKDDIDIIICESFETTGIGEAIMNRLQKAASARF